MSRRAGQQDLGTISAGSNTFSASSPQKLLKPCITYLRRPVCMCLPGRLNYMSAIKNLGPMFAFETRLALVLITPLLSLCIINGRLCTFTLMRVLRRQLLTWRHKCSKMKRTEYRLCFFS